MAGLGIALVAAVVAAILLGAAEDRERTARLDEATARGDAEKRQEEARWNLYVAQMNLVQRDYEGANMAHVRERFLTPDQLNPLLFAGLE